MIILKRLPLWLSGLAAIIVLVVSLMVRLSFLLIIFRLLVSVCIFFILGRLLVMFLLLKDKPPAKRKRIEPESPAEDYEGDFEELRPPVIETAGEEVRGGR